MNAAHLKGALAALAWAGGALALCRMAPLVALFPALGALQGPLGFGLGGLAAGVALARLLEGRVRLVIPHAAVLFALSVAVLIPLGFRYSDRMRVSGDEPHYLLMAQSLWREGDLDLRDNFDRGDYREYLPALPAPHYGAPRADGRPFPAHSAGLPALLAPVYALGGRRACVVLLALAAAALALQVRTLAERATGDPRAAFWAWAAALGPPVAFYAFHTYTELPSALALAVALRLILEPVGPAGAAFAAVFASALPWLHVKMIPASAALGLVALVRLSGHRRLAFLAVATLMAAAYLGYYDWVLGSPTPLALYGGVAQGFSTSPITAVSGLLLDRSFGLLPVAPLFVLALAGLPLFAQGRLRDVGPQVFVGLAVLPLVVTWRMWWGGQCPPARFLVPLVPLLGVALAARLVGPARGLARWRWALLGAGVVLTIFATAQPERMLLLNRRDRPTRLWDALSAPDGAQAGRYLPSLVSAAPAERRVAVLWVGALLLLLLLDGVAARRDDVDRLFRGLGLPLLLALSIGVLVDGWARSGPGALEPASVESPEDG